MYGWNLAKNIGWQGLAIAVFIIGELAITILLSKGLGSQSFGLYAFAFAYAFIGYQVVDLRLADALIAHYPDYARRNIDSAHALAGFTVLLDVARAVAGLALILVTAPIIVPLVWSDGPAIAEVTLMGVFMFFNNLLLGSSRGYMRTTGAFRRQALLQTLASVLKLTAVGWAMWRGAQGIETILIWMCVAGVAFVLINFYLLANLAKAKGFTIASAAKGMDHLRYQHLGRFIGHNYIAGLSGIVTKELDVLILSSFAGAAAVGVYRLAKSFAGGLGAMWDALFFVLFPEISRLLANGQTDKLRLLIRLNIRLGLGLSLLSLAGGTFAVWLIVRLFYGGQGYDLAPWLFAILAARLVVWAPMIWLNPLVLSLHHAKLSAQSAWIGAAVTSILFYLLTWLLQAPGLAIASALSSAAFILPLYILANKQGLLKVVWPTSEDKT